MNASLFANSVKNSGETISRNFPHTVESCRAIVVRNVDAKETRKFKDVGAAGRFWKVYVSDEGATKINLKEGDVNSYIYDAKGRRLRIADCVWQGWGGFKILGFIQF